MARHALLTAEEHRTLRLRTGRSVELGDAVMSCLTVPMEFRRVQNSYPILFRRTAMRDGFSAVALFGLREGENLFLTDAGWDARTIPMAMAVQPFLIGPPAPGTDMPQVHIDLDSPRLGPDGEPLFDSAGQPTPLLERAAALLGDLDHGYRESGAFLHALERHRLLEPLTLDVTLADGSISRLVGFHTIDEDRLRALEPAVLAELHADGHLMPIFMAVASLANIGALIERRNRRCTDG